MLKKTAAVAAMSAGLMLAGGSAFAASAAPSHQAGDLDGDGVVNAEEATKLFTHGGKHLGQGAAEGVAGAYWGAPQIFANTAQAAGMLPAPH